MRSGVAMLLRHAAAAVLWLSPFRQLAQPHSRRPRNRSLHPYPAQTTLWEQSAEMTQGTLRLAVGAALLLAVFAIGERC